MGIAAPEQGQLPRHHGLFNYTACIFLKPLIYSAHPHALFLINHGLLSGQGEEVRMVNSLHTFYNAISGVTVLSTMYLPR
jgi:hypothetical protein